MGYEIAINKAWQELSQLNPPKDLAVEFFADEYSVDLTGQKVISLSCNIAAKDFPAILILHYLIQKIKGLPDLVGEWLNFRELSGIEGYSPAFRQRAIEPLIRKYGAHPEGILETAKRLAVKKVQGGDVSIVIEAFERVPVLVKLWKPDAEFGADANILFDRSITQIFCTEDIVVLAGMVTAQL